MMIKITYSILYGGEITMSEKKFHVPSIVFGAAALALGFVGLSVESLAAAIVAIVLALRKKQTYLVKLGIVLAASAIVISGAFMGFQLFLHAHDMTRSSYWLYVLIFGKAL